MNGAQRLSQAILHSGTSPSPSPFLEYWADGKGLRGLDAELVKRNQDLSGQIVARRERLGWLIQFISDNAALPKVRCLFCFGYGKDVDEMMGQMSQKSRQRLATDAEKLFACHLLWNQHSQLLA